VMGLVKTTELLGFALAASGGPIRPGDPPTEWPPATFMDTGRSLSGTPHRQTEGCSENSLRSGSVQA
jgi:hypothetical protein